MNNTDPDFKPPCQLLGRDSNVYNLVGIASRTLKQHGLHEKASEMADRVYKSHSYNDALAIIMEYVDVC